MLLQVVESAVQARKAHYLLSFENKHGDGTVPVVVSSFDLAGNWKETSELWQHFGLKPILNWVNVCS